MISLRPKDCRVRGESSGDPSESVALQAGTADGTTFDRDVLVLSALHRHAAPSITLPFITFTLQLAHIATVTILLELT